MALGKKSFEDLNEVRGKEETVVASNGETSGKTDPSAKLDDMFNPSRGNTHIPDTVPVLGLDITDSLLIDGSANEIISDFIEGATAALKETKIDIKIFKVEASRFDLGFDSIMFAHKANNGKVYYFITVLEGTGRAPLTVNQIVEELGRKDSLADLVTSDVLDDKFDVVINTILSSAFSGTTKDNYVSCEAVVLPLVSDVKQTAPVIAKLAHNLIFVKYALEVKQFRDIDVATISKAAKGGFITVDLAFNTGITINKLGKPIRSDFTIEGSIGSNATVKSFNGQNAQKLLSNVNGYLEYIVGEETNPYTGEVTRYAEPLVILNEFNGKVPSLNYQLLSIINATTFTNRNILKSLLVEKDAGALNYLFNFGGDGNKFGEKISFKDPNADPEIINAIIRKHIRPTPLFAVEVEIAGADYPYMTPFVALGSPMVMQAATTDILTASANLTGQSITSQQVAATEGSLIPIGYYVDAEGNTRDLREIDLTFIIKYSNDPSLVFDWIYSNAPANVCMSVKRMDPYTLKLNVLDKLAKQLEFKLVITAKAMRVVLSGQFVSELVTKAKIGGYNPNVDSPFITHSDYNNLQMVAASYENAAVADTGFGIQRLGQTYTIGSVNPYGYRY